VNWQRIGPYVLEGEHGYRISKSLIGTEARYRASHNGSFIGAPVSTAEEAKAQVEAHLKEAA